MNKSLYSLVLYWPQLMEVVEKKDQGGKMVVDQGFMLSLCAFLSLGASFSSKLSQMLASAVPFLEQPKNFNKQQEACFLILIEHLLDTNDRAQVARLTADLSKRQSEKATTETNNFEEQVLALMALSVLRRNYSISHAGSDEEHQRQLEKLLMEAIQRTSSPTSSAVAEGSYQLILGIVKEIFEREQKLSKFRLHLEAALVNFGKPSKTEVQKEAGEIEVNFKLLLEGP